MDGIRALAVVLVIFSHADISFFTGGYIGVDIFFVISGFLITGLLLNEYNQNGKVNLICFYSKRAKRLIPALATMLIGASISAYFILPTVDQVGQAESAFSSLLWISNFYFSLLNIDYFGIRAENNIFLHTWSLSVEEQFYLVWPILIIVFSTITKKKSYPVKILKVMLVAIIALSLIVNVFSTYTNHTKVAFYMMPLRAWQFALGALVFIAITQCSTASLACRNTASLGGISLILISVITLKNSSLYPGIYALSPTAGAALLIWSGHAGSGERTTLSRLLSHPICRYFGNISYSWYLWHWPVFVLGAHIYPEESATTIAMIFLSLALAIATYHIIEKPARYSTYFFPTSTSTLIRSGALTAVLLCTAYIWTTHLEYTLDNNKHSKYEQARNDQPRIYDMNCDDYHRSSHVVLCEFGNPNAKKTAVIMGDSIGLQWFSAYEKIFNNKDWRLLVLTKSSCPINGESIYDDVIKREYTECMEWKSSAFSMIQIIKPDIMIFGSAYYYNYTLEQWEYGTEKVLQKISPFVGEVYLIRGTPVLNFNAPTCLSKYSNDQDKHENCQSRIEPEKEDPVWKAQQKALQKYDNAMPLDLNRYVCPEGVCLAEDDYIIHYRDHKHISSTYAHALAEEMRVEMRRAKQANTSK
nr:acyltransferase family protein [Marinagarivorans cellulosilyticus]